MIRTFLNNKTKTIIFTVFESKQPKRPKIKRIRVLREISNQDNYVFDFQYFRCSNYLDSNSFVSCINQAQYRFEESLYKLNQDYQNSKSCIFVFSHRIKCNSHSVIILIFSLITILSSLIRLNNTCRIFLRDSDTRVLPVYILFLAHTHSHSAAPLHMAIYIRFPAHSVTQKREKRKSSSIGTHITF